MKKTMLVIATTSILLSTNAVAGVAEKKAFRAADANIAKQVIKTISKCGNVTLDVSVNWTDVTAMIKANKEALQADKYAGKWVISQTGDRTVSALEAMAKICEEDEDYKEEIANVAAIIVNPKAKYSDTRNTFSINDTSITIESGHRMTRNLFDFIKPIKALF